MMVYHFIAIASGFVQGTRIAWHYASEGKLDQERIVSFMKEAAEQNGTHFGIHKLSTESLEWRSVVEKDSFFSDIYATDDEELFLKMLSEDQGITALDIAKFILILLPMSHLKLQKMVYLAYSEYLLSFKKPLFKEDVVAYKYGPVIEEVYHKFKKYGAEEISEVDEKYSFKIRDTEVPPLFMKLLSSEDGAQIIKSVAKVIGKYKDYTAGQLVDLTHAPGSPWSNTYTGRYPSPVISDETIEEFHMNEVL